jgi:hypothetical protein
MPSPLPPSESGAILAPNPYNPYSQTKDSPIRAPELAGVWDNRGVLPRSPDANHS